MSLSTDLSACLALATFRLQFAPDFDLFLIAFDLSQSECCLRSGVDFALSNEDEREDDEGLPKLLAHDSCFFRGWNFLFMYRKTELILLALLPITSFLST